jgi:hypothetical protein
LVIAIAARLSVGQDKHRSLAAGLSVSAVTLEPGGAEEPVDAVGPRLDALNIWMLEVS